MAAGTVAGRRRRRWIYAGLACAGLLLVWAISSTQRAPSVRAVDAGQMMSMQSEEAPVPASAAPARAMARGGGGRGGGGGRAGGGGMPVRVGGEPYAARAAEGEGDTAGIVRTTQASPWPVSPMLIRTGSLSLRVDDVLKVQERIGQLARVAGGYVADSNVNSEAKPTSATITIRVPNEGLDDLADQIAGLGRLLSRKIGTQEVTEEYVDLASRKRNLQREEMRLLDLLGRAGRVRDLLEVEQEVSRVHGDVEMIAGRMRYLENRVTFSTVQVQLVGPPPAARPSHVWAARDVVRQAAASLLSAGRSLTTLAIWLAIFIPVWVPLVLVALWTVRRGLWTLHPQRAPSEGGAR